MPAFGNADRYQVTNPHAPRATREDVDAWLRANALAFSIGGIEQFQRDTGVRFADDALDCLDLTPAQRTEFAADAAGVSPRRPSGEQVDAITHNSQQAPRKKTSRRARRHRVTEIGHTPRAGEDRRAHGKDLRWSKHVPRGLIEVTPDLIVVPEDEYGSVLSAFARRTWSGTLPTRSVPTPYRLRLCIDAPRNLFMRPGRERQDYEFRSVWEPLHHALEADLAAALEMPHDESTAPTQLPDVTLNQLLRRRKALAPELGRWIAAASAVVEESRAALHVLIGGRVEVAQDGDVVHEPWLPAPWVAYPPSFGLCMAYAASKEGPFRLCECSRDALEAYAEAADAGQDRDWPHVKAAMSSLVRCGRNLHDILADPGVWAPNVCHRCNGATPSRLWATGVGTFDQSHGWFVAQALAVAGVFGLAGTARERRLARVVENEVRKSFGHPNVGEGWVRETQLAQLLAQCLPGRKIVRHYRPEWMQRLEFDIWVPSLRLAVEHQGQQHFTPISAWGGAEALTRTQERDARKVELAKANDVTLLHFRYDEPLTTTYLSGLLVGAGVTAAR